MISILIPLILLIGLMIFHDVLYGIYPMNRPSISFGITIYYSWIIFGILFLIFNYIVLKMKNKYVIGLIFFLISIILPLEAISIRPFRAPLMIIMFLSGFGLSIIIREMALKIETVEIVNNGKPL